MRTSRCSASSSAGGRVCGVIVSSPWRGPSVSASRTSTQPLGRLPRRDERVGARLVGARGGVVDAERPEPERARPAVEQRAEHARRVEARHAQPVDRAVGRHQRAGVAVRQEARSRRSAGTARAPPRSARRGLAARRRSAVGGALMTPPTGRASRRSGRRARPPPAGPQLPFAYGCTGRRRVEQRLQDAPRLLDAVLAGEARAVAQHRGVQQHLVGRRRPPLPAARTRGRARTARRCASAAGCASTSSLTPGRRVEPDHQLARLGLARPVAVEDEPGRAPEDEPQLGLGDRQVLAGADEERHALPAPVVDLQPHRRVGLGGRSRRATPSIVAVAVVLPAHVVRRVGGGHGREHRVEGVLERARARRRLHRRGADAPASGG